MFPNSQHETPVSVGFKEEDEEGATGEPIGPIIVQTETQRHQSSAWFTITQARMIAAKHGLELDYL